MRMFIAFCLFGLCMTLTCLGGNGSIANSLSPDKSIAVHALPGDSGSRIVLVEELRGTELQQFPLSRRAAQWFATHGIDQVLWAADGTAVAVTVSNDAASEVYACIRDIDGTWRTHDLSGVEDRNRGKLGRPKEDFRRVRHSLLKWADSKSGFEEKIIPGRILWVQTRFWDHKGQRYTVREPVAIELSGRIVWR
jgi:hypothetical protein